MNQTLRSRAYSPQIPGSNFDPQTDYLDWDISWSSSDSPDKFWTVHNRFPPLPFQSIIHN